MYDFFFSSAALASSSRQKFTDTISEISPLSTSITASFIACWRSYPYIGFVHSAEFQLGFGFYLFRSSSLFSYLNSANFGAVCLRLRFGAVGDLILNWNWLRFAYVFEIWSWTGIGLDLLIDLGFDLELELVGYWTEFVFGCCMPANYSLICPNEILNFVPCLKLLCHVLAF